MPLLPFSLHSCFLSQTRFSHNPVVVVPANLHSSLVYPTTQTLLLTFSLPPFPLPSHTACFAITPLSPLSFSLLLSERPHLCQRCKRRAHLLAVIEKEGRMAVPLPSHRACGDILHHLPLVPRRRRVEVLHRLLKVQVQVEVRGQVEVRSSSHAYF